MDEKEKFLLIKDLLEDKFDKNKFINFIARILNVTVKEKSEYEHIWKEYRDYIKSYQEFCDYKDSNDQKIYIIAVKIKNINEFTGEKIDPVRARGKQRDFLAKLLRERKRDGALAIFYNEEDPHWRISLVRLDYAFTLDGIKKTLTPAKRLSYVVGKGESNRTAIEQFEILAKLKESVTLDQIEDVFKLEKVTDDFFKAYREKYLFLKDHLEKDSTFIKIAETQTKETKESFIQGFSKKLMGQIAFLYFLQKKGWLGVSRVPKKLDSSEYDRIYRNSSEKTQEILDLVYEVDDKDVYKLSKKAVDLTNEDSDRLANAFKNLREYDQPWGTGDKKFIRTLFKRHTEIQEKIEKKKNFFDDYLEYLFYEALNIDRGENDYFSRFNCRIPYLNGGLFEAYGNYQWRETSFHIPDSMFSNDEENGILDIFDRYNFTICENEPYETEVAVDPEMLGKVFENLLEVKDRKSKGAFYTPREIVHYMCKESLENFLKNEISGINREHIEYLIQLGEFAKEYDQHIFEKEYMDHVKEGKEFKNEWGMPKFIRENALKIDEALKNCKIADPAIGSGAFPLGMLTEIVKARNTLTQYLLINEGLELSKEDIKKYWELKRKKYNDRSLYKLKMNTIENSLFGVDLEPSAIEIAKLRLWLSIVVDTASDSIKPLPNLDFNFRCGDSLMEEYQGIKLFNEEILNANHKKLSKNNAAMMLEFSEIEMMKNISKLHHDFFNPYVKNKKGLKEHIESLEWKLIEYNLRENNNISKIEELRKLQEKNQKPYFIWKLEFGDVFREKGGFDIIIGNPPYLRVQGIKEFNPEIAEAYKEKYKSATGSYDLYVLFTERALELVKDGGTVNFIMPHKWVNASFGKGLREIIGLGEYMYKFISFGAYQVFNASTYTSLIWLEKSKHKYTKYYEFDRDVTDNKMLESSLNSLSDESYVKIENEKLKPLKIKKGSTVKFQDTPWNLMPENNLKIIEKVERHQRKISEIFSNVFTGLQTSKDTVYFLHNCFKIDDLMMEGYSQELNKNIVIEKKLVKPLLKGDMVHRYEGIETDKVVILPYDISGNKAELYTEEDMKKKFPMGYAYLKECEEVLKMRENGRLKNDINWYKYIYPKNLVNFKNEKLIAPDISKGCNFTYDQSGEFYSTSTVYGYIKNDFIKESYKFLMAVLNSKVLWYYLTNTGAVMANGFFRFKTSYIKPFPIPELKDLEMTKPFETLVDYIVFIKANRNSFEDLNASTDYLISFFEDILNFMAYELYFDKETQENELEIIKYAQRDLGALENKSFEDKVFEIKKSFIKISERENEIRNNMILMKLKLEDLIMPIERSI